MSRDRLVGVFQSVIEPPATTIGVLSVIIVACDLRFMPDDEGEVVDRLAEPAGVHEG